MSNSAEHVTTTLIQSRYMEESAQRLRADAAKMYRQLSIPDRHEVSRATGFTFQTLEMLSASLR